MVNASHQNADVLTGSLSNRDRGATIISHLVSEEQASESLRYSGDSIAITATLSAVNSASATKEEVKKALVDA